MEKEVLKNIGLLVAVEIEAVIKQCGKRLQSIQKNGFTVYILEEKGYRLHFVHSKVGTIRAAAATQMLCDTFSIQGMINFGVVGALTEQMQAADACFVSKTIHYDMDTTALDHNLVGQYDGYPDAYLPTSPDILKRVQALYPTFPTIICACADKFVSDSSQKEALHQKFGASICDMESAAVVLICDLHKIPNVIIKTVSDTVRGGASEYLQKGASAAEVCVQIVEKIIEAKIF